MVKKKLVMIAAFCLSMCAVSVKAEECGFKRIGQEYPRLQVTGMNVGSSTFTVTIEPNGYVMPYVNDVLQKYPGEREVKIVDPSNHHETRSYKVSGWRSDNWGNYTVNLDSPLKSTDKISLQIADDGNFFLGNAIYRSSSELSKESEQKLKAEEEQRLAEEKKKAEEQRLLEEAMLKQMRENDHKTWHQRLSDSIQDQWWNFKGWWRG
ncbi:hypothetical protein [Streptococcus pyogenes]|uniref:hypothetical protein n=1 Tax=Streptococcus pyogenes TaxID=1314 RepID=UPI002ACD9250|nr:hypothetical protein [Streptococcus pyogenes]